VTEDPAGVVTAIIAVPQQFVGVAMRQVKLAAICDK
jgi:hypothetical protein